MEQQGVKTICQNFNAQGLRFILHTIDDHRREEVKLLILDMSETEYLNSESIGLLVDIQLTLSEYNISMVMAKLSSYQQRLIHLTQARDFLKVYETPELAAADPVAYEVVSVNQ